MAKRTFLLPIVLFCSGFLSAQTGWTLEQCMTRAEERNLSLVTAGYERDLVFQDERAAKWGFLPNLNGAATYGYNWGQTIDRYTNTFATDRVRTNNFFLSSNWNLFSGFSQQNQYRKAKLDNLSAEEGIAAARVNVLTSVVQRFMEMLGAEEQIKASRITTERTREQIVLTEAMVEAGRTARVELLDLRAQLAREEYDLVSAENIYQQSRLQMAQLLQLTPVETNTFSIVPPSLSSLEPTEPTATVEQIMQRVRETHPAYKQAQLKVESAERSVEIARAGGIPSLNFNANIATGYSGRNVQPVGDPIYGDPNLAGFTENGELVYTPNIRYETETRAFGDQLQDNLNYSTAWNLSIPLFNNMRNRTNFQQARIRYEQSRVQQTQQEQQLQLTVQQALADQRAAYRQFLAARNSHDASEEALRYAAERFDQGSINALELSTAKANLNRATTDMIRARYNYLVAAGSLDILQGLPLSL